MPYLQLAAQLVSPFVAHLVSQLAALHLGALHTYEKLFVLLLAFGPFVVLGVVVHVVRKRDIALEQAAEGEGASRRSG